MTPQFWLAIAGALVGLFNDPDTTAIRAHIDAPDAAHYGPPARAAAGSREAEAPAAAEGPEAPAAAEPSSTRPEDAEPPLREPREQKAKSRDAAGEPAAERRVAQVIPVPEVEDKGTRDEEPSADEVVEGVQSFYETTEHLTAVFRQVYTNQTFGRESVSDGRVWLKKPGKMRWDYQNERTGDVHKSFISNGSQLWALEHDNKQAFRKDLEDTVLPVAVTFLTGEGKLSEDFHAELDESGTYGAPGDYVLELRPREPSAKYKTLWLVVDPDNFRAKQSIVLEASGNTNHFRFYEPNTERPVKDSWFEVDESELRGYRILEPEDQ